MNTHALAVLEFPQVLDLVAQRASSALGAERVRTLAPTADREWIEQEHARVGAMRALIAGPEGWRPEPIPELGAALGRLRAAGSVWRGHELLAGALLLRSARCTRETLLDPARRDRAAALAPWLERLVVAKPVETAIEHAIEQDGTVKDDASPLLRRLRRELRGAESELVQLLERLMSRLEPQHRVPDMSVTVRNGRYVIPIRREARAVVGGIVHDQSGTGSTLFVEPPAALEMGNRIRELEAEAQEEVERILGELTDTLRPLREAMVDSLEVLVALDALYARARFAEELQCAPVELAAPGTGFTIREGRHPLLLAQGRAVIPFDLTMEPEERTLLISGPNTGGKTVLLKAIGLISALTQAGLPSPVGAGSRIAVYDDCFADIGDEQSIEASLSTFSAHLRNLGEILTCATPHSLVLIDELGSGTDPAEGAALGGAILEELTRRGTFTAAATHLGTLKLLATEVTGVVNASLQFDERALEPTYRLIKGIPGRSYGLAIARRLQLPSDVLARAEARLSSEERDLAALVADLEQREVALAEREARAREAAAAATARLARVEERERAVRDAERAAERRAREETRRYLLDARAEVERAIRELRSSATSEQAAREARRRVEELASDHAAALAELARADERPLTAAGVGGEVAPGDVVELETLNGRTGQLVELRGDDAVVAVGSLKLTVPRRTLTRRSRPRPEAESVPRRGELPDVHAPTEIDVRGLRVDEMERAVLQALDAAVHADLRSLRIIHGKGTGVLRERVAELLRGDRRVRAYRLGAWSEGGSGVTIAELG